MTNSVIFYHPPCPAAGTSWYNYIISTLNSPSFCTYIFPSFNIKSPSICHSFPYSSYTFTFFISSTILTTSSSLLLAFFIFSTMSTSGSSITTSSNLQIQLFLINIWFSLSFSIPIFQSSCYNLKLKLRLHLGKDLRVDKKIDWSDKA